MKDLKNIIIEPPILNFPGVNAFFTDRSINDISDVSRVMNIPLNSIYAPLQKHTATVHVLRSDLKPVIADAVITDKKGVLIGVQTADCVPILLYDKNRFIVGAVHAGWRGTAKEILRNTIKAMQEQFQSSAGDVFVAIGPSIRECCYEVGSDVKSDVLRATGDGAYFRSNGDKYFIDLSFANRLQALSMGVPQKNIWQSAECTYCNPGRFYSYRHAKGSTGRQGGFIGMW